MDDWGALVHYLSDKGVSPSGILLILMVSWSLFKGYRREAASVEREKHVADRQDELDSRLDRELVRINKLFKECEDRRTELEAANLALDRWKADCLDICPVHEDVHKVRGIKWPPKQ